MYQGQIIIGTFAGITHKPWDFNGNSGITTKVGIQIGESVDDFGNTSPQVISVKVHKDDVPRFSNEVVQHLKGKSIYIQVRYDAKDGYNGAYVQPTMPKEGAFGFADHLSKLLEPEKQAEKPTVRAAS